MKMNIGKIFEVSKITLRIRIIKKKLNDQF